MQDNKVIEALGDGKSIADDLNSMIDSANVTPDQVYAWKSRNRIPGEWRPWIARLAAARIPEFSSEAFLLSAKPRGYTRKTEAA